MIKNFIFDFGNVLTLFDNDALTSIYVKDEKLLRLISDTVYDRLYWDRLDDGTISDEEVERGFCSILPKEHHTLAKKVFRNWITNLTPIEKMPELVGDIKKSGAGLYLLSNISVTFAQRYHENAWIKELLSLFDGLVFSGVVGMVKPEESIFRHLINTYSLKAEECLFIDDSEKNLNGAKKLGINTYHFDGDADKLRQKIFC